MRLPRRGFGRSWALAPIFRLHGTVLPPAGLESGLVAHSTGPAQNRTRTSRSRLIEPSRYSCMPLLELLSLSSLVDVSGRGFHPLNKVLIAISDPHQRSFRIFHLLREKARFFCAGVPVLRIIQEKFVVTSRHRFGRGSSEERWSP